jgi:predicted O-methyltransferase YrrM
MPSIIPEVDMSQIINNKIAIETLEPLAEIENINLLELTVINNLVKGYNPQTLFEIGTFNGRTTLNMAANVSEETKIYTLDLPPDKQEVTEWPISAGDKENIERARTRVGSSFLGTKFADRITQLYGDSANFDFTPFSNSIDFIFIDGAHSYDYVLNDSEKSINLLRNGKGIILWHDHGGGLEGVTKALNELYATRPEYKNLKHIKGTSLAILINQ